MLHLQPSADFSFFANHFLTFGSLCGGVKTKTHNGTASCYGGITIVCLFDLCIGFLLSIIVSDLHYEVLIRFGNYHFECIRWQSESLSTKF